MPKSAMITGCNYSSELCFSGKDHAFAFKVHKLNAEIFQVHFLQGMYVYANSFVTI